jgi:hypothetical protein
MFKYYMTSLSNDDDDTIWKATKSLKRPQISIPLIRKANGGWAKIDSDEAITFVGHLEQAY